MIVGISKEPFLVRGRTSYHYKVDGRRKSLETTKLTEARDTLRKLRRIYFDGKLHELRDECAISLQAFLRDALAWAEGHYTKNTASAFRAAVNAVLAHVNSSTRLDRFSYRTMDDFVTARIKQAKVATVNKEIRHTRILFNKAVDWGYLKRNPVARYKQLKAPERLPCFMDGKDLPRFLSGIEDVDLRRLTMAYLVTGRRASELLRLKWADVVMQEGRYRVIQKGDQEKWFPVSAAFQAVLDSLDPATEWVFPRWRSRHTVTRLVKKELVRFGYPHLTLHSLRHTFATRFIEEGGDIRVLQELMGHTDIKTTRIYAHVTQHHLREEINRVKVGPVDLAGTAGVQAKKK